MQSSNAETEAMQKDINMRMRREDENILTVAVERGGMDANGAGQKGRGMGQGHRGREAEGRGDERQREVLLQGGLRKFYKCKGRKSQ